jgi:PAS domain S-box-containing protein
MQVDLEQSELERLRAENRRIRKQLREAEEVLQAIRNGEVDALVVGDRLLNLEDALRESEERFRTLADNMSQLAWMAEPSGDIFWYNRRWFEYTGTTSEQMRGWGWQQVHHPAHVRRVIATLRHSLQTGEPWEDTFPLRGKDGNYRWFLSRALPIRDDSGKIVRWFGTNTDITERLKSEEDLRQSEQEVRRLNEHLEALVAERTARLEELVRELNAFTSSVSHDLRAPLRAMNGHATALLEDCAASLDPLCREYVQRIIGAAERMDTLIQDLLSYSRLTREDIVLRPVRLAVVIADARLQAEAALRDSRAELTVDEPLPVVVAYRPTLVQVLTNLLTNAVKFVGPGVRPRVHIYAENRQRQVRLWIEDNGIGIAPEHRERIFQIFERLHSVASYPGTGIGLAIVRKGIERMGGTVGVESEVGQGSRFWIQLPAGKEEP